MKGSTKVLTTGERMIQWIGVLLALLGFAYNGVKDYQKGDIKLPIVSDKELTTTNYPIQYCLMAYDPNLDKVFYLHDNGIWYDYAPEQRRYAATPQYIKDQNQKGLAVADGSSGRSGQYLIR